MHMNFKTSDQAGFTIIELIIALSIMLIVGGAVFSLMRDSMKVASTTYEMTDTQEALRTGQEYINRDLMNAGDGLNNINNIRVPRNFVTSYLGLNPIDDPTPGVADLQILTSDDNVPANTTVTGTNPVTKVRTNPFRTDRLSVLQIDPIFTPIALPPNAISADGSTIALTPGDEARFGVGEIYFLTSELGATFGTITNITGTPTLEFAAGDACGLNSPGIGGISAVSAAGTIATSLMRIKIIHYYVDSKGILMRRVFGVQGAAYTDSLIAEHVTNLQFRYFLSMRDASGNVVQPEAQLTTSEQQLAINQVEVALTAETPHVIHNNAREQLTMTTSISVRNMQFKGAWQPNAGS
jgi:prepilin-type N-terminal cleavage/methylation domain-containing protein